MSKGAVSHEERGCGSPPTGHLTMVGRAEVTLQAVLSASVSLLRTATICTVFDCEVALWVGLIACRRFNTRIFGVKVSDKWER